MSSAPPPSDLQEAGETTFCPKMLLPNIQYVIFDSFLPSPRLILYARKIGLQRMTIYKHVHHTGTVTNYRQSIFCDTFALKS